MGEIKELRNLVEDLSSNLFKILSAEMSLFEKDVRSYLQLPM